MNHHDDQPVRPAEPKPPSDTDQNRKKLATRVSKAAPSTPQPAMAHLGGIERRAGAGGGGTAGRRVGALRRGPGWAVAGLLRPIALLRRGIALRRRRVSGLRRTESLLLWRVTLLRRVARLRRDIRAEGRTRAEAAATGPKRRRVVGPEVGNWAAARIRAAGPYPEGGWLGGPPGGG